MAGKPAPSRNEPLCQWHQAPVTLIYQWKIKEGMGGGWRKHNPKAEQSKWLLWKHCISLQSTWSWCKQGWLCLHHHADCWVLTDNRRWCSLFLTVLNLTSFHLFPFESLAMALYWQQDSKEKFWLIKETWSTNLRTDWFNIVLCHIVPAIAWQRLIFARIKKISLCCDSKGNIFWKAWGCTWLSKWSEFL